MYVDGVNSTAIFIELCTTQPNIPDWLFGLFCMKQVIIIMALDLQVGNYYIHTYIKSIIN